MKGENLIAREMQDLAGAVGEIKAAINHAAAVAAQVRAAADEASVTLRLPSPTTVVNVPEGPAPVVYVETAAPVVNVAAPTVNVAAPRVSVEAAAPVAYKVQVTKRDKDGLIEEFVLYPVQIVEG